MHRARFYLGVAGFGSIREVFSSTAIPTEETAPRYAAAIGPFRTRRGAEYMRDNPGPCVVTVADAERLARKAQTV